MKKKVKARIKWFNKEIEVSEGDNIGISCGFARFVVLKISPKTVLLKDCNFPYSRFRERCLDLKKTKEKE